MPRAALLLLAALALASCVHAEEDVVTVSGMKHLKKLAKAHPFLVVEVRAAPWAPPAAAGRVIGRRAIGASHSAGAR